MNTKKPHNSKCEVLLNEKPLREDQEMVHIMSKLLNVDKSKIKKAMHLFSGIDPQMKICFYKLYKLEQKHYVSAFMLLEYLLVFAQKAMTIIEEDS